MGKGTKPVGKKLADGLVRKPELAHFVFVAGAVPLPNGAADTDGIALGSGAWSTAATVEDAPVPAVWSLSVKASEERLDSTYNCDSGFGRHGDCDLLWASAST